MLDQITRIVVPVLCNAFKKLCGPGLAGMVVFLFATQASQGQCSISPSTVNISGPGAYCPNSSFSVSLRAFSDQTYTFFHNGQPIPGYVQLSNAGHRRRSLSYDVSNMSPSDAGSYSVVVYDACGDSLFLNTVFAYYEGIAALSIGLVKNTAAGFYWSAGPPGSTYSWAIDTTNTFPGSGVSLFSGNTTDTFANVTGLREGLTYYVFVSIQNSNCNPNPVWVANSFTTLAACTPVPAITPSGPLTFCAGGSVVLSSSSANSYTWYRNDTVVGQTSQSLTVISSGNYTVQVTNSGGCLATSAPVTVNVNPLPPVPTISGRTVLNSCIRDADTLLSSAPGGNQWLSNNSPIPGETNNYLIVHTSGNYSVQVTVAGQCAAVSTSTAVTAIGSSPAPTINPTGTVTICAGDSTLLTSSLPAGNQWYKDGVALPGDTLQKLYVSVTGNYTVFGGTGLCASQSIPTIVSSSGIQGTPMIKVVGSLTICQGGSVLLQSSVPAGNQWYFNGQALFGENNPTYNASAAGNYIVAVGSGACQVFSTAAIVTVVANPPIPVIAYTNSNLCSGSVMLQSSSDSGNTWYLDTVPIPGATGMTYTPMAPGNYRVMVSFEGNCSSLSAPVTITGSSAVIPLVKILNGVLSSDSVNGNQWYLNDSLIPGATQNSYTPKVPGTYTLRFNHNGCISNFSAPLVVKAGDLTTPNVSVFPNPAKDHLTIVNKGANPIMLQIYDMAGRRIQTVESISGTYQLRTSQLTRGPYYILITDEKNKNKTRLLVLKL